MPGSETVPKALSTDLYQVGRALRAAIPMVVPVDGQHAVVLLQLPVTGRHTSLQQVEDKNPGLIGPADQLYAQLLIRAALVQDDVEAVVPVAVGLKGKPAVSAPVPLLPEHREPQHVAGLLQDRQGVVVRHVFDVHAVHLEGRAINQQH